LSAQPAVLQVVILRDGLLVGTEVFAGGIGARATTGVDVDVAASVPKSFVPETLIRSVLPTSSAPST